MFRCREVLWSRWLARYLDAQLCQMHWHAEGVNRRQPVSVVSGSRDDREYARGIYEGIAALADELVLCVRRICMAGVDGAYAHAVLAIDALGESVSLSNHDRIWGVMTQQDRRTTLDQ